MAVASIILKRKLNVPSRGVVRRVAIQVTGTYPSGGETIDLTTMTNPLKAERGKFGGVAGSTKALPLNSDVATVQTPDGYEANLKQAAASPTLKNYVLTLWTSGDTALSGSYPANLASQDIIFDIVTPLKYS